MIQKPKTTIHISLIFLLLLLQTGCVGTLMGMTMGEEISILPNPPDNKIYVGVRFDTANIGNIVSGDSNINPLALPLLILDLPISFAADTVLLPYTIPDAVFFSEKKPGRSQS